MPEQQSVLSLPRSHKKEKKRAPSPPSIQPRSSLIKPYASDLTRTRPAGVVLSSASLDAGRDASKEATKKCPLLVFFSLTLSLSSYSRFNNRLLAHGKKLSKVKIMSVNVSETW